MNILENISLKPYNTFGIDVKAKHFVSVASAEELKEVLKKFTHLEPFILGGGSNMLLTKDMERLVVHINLKGIEVIDSDVSESEVLVKVAGGENWHEFVIFCVDHNLGGVENLSLIPGNVGTSPVQNIGAYGVELKDTFYSCEAVHRKTQALRTFTLEDCKFGYRESVFKSDLKDEYVITSVTFKLTKAAHKITIDYGAINETLREKSITEPSLKDVSNAVIAIRQSKLPDPKKIGNSGSFFKNPVITQEEFSQLRKEHSEIPYYPIGNDWIKVPAGWLIEQAGFKGKRFGDAGVHDRQALVLVNHGSATGKEVWDVAMKVQAAVLEKFGIKIEPEVNVF